MIDSSEFEYYLNEDDKKLYMISSTKNILFSEYLQYIYWSFFYLFRKEKICVLRMTKILDNLKKNVTPRLSDKIVSELNVIINNFTILKNQFTIIKLIITTVYYILHHNFFMTINI